MIKFPFIPFASLLVVGGAVLVLAKTSSPTEQKPAAPPAVEKPPENRIAIFQNGSKERSTNDEKKALIFIDAQTGKQYLGFPDMGMIEITRPAPNAAPVIAPVVAPAEKEK